MGANKVVLYGGSNYSYSGALGDTWTFDGAAWTSVPGTGPGLRAGHKMVYDANRSVLVMFGGASNTGAARNDTWEFNGTSWTNRMPASGNPPARIEHSLAYDPSRGVTVLFGGTATGGGGYFNDVWEWDGTAWTDRTPVMGSPGLRYGASLGFDPVRGLAVLFGGHIGTGLGDDEWTWDGSTWTQLTRPRPTARADFAMVNVPGPGNLMLFGGMDPGALGLSDTWFRP